MACSMKQVGDETMERHRQKGVAVPVAAQQTLRRHERCCTYSVREVCSHLSGRRKPTPPRPAQPKPTKATAKAPPQQMALFATGTPKKPAQPRVPFLAQLQQALLQRGFALVPVS